MPLASPWPLWRSIRPGGATARAEWIRTRMRRRNPLDRYVEAFQHRWETDRQYRAALSGVFALVAVIGLCSCVGVATAFTNMALARFGSGTTSGQNNTGSLLTGSNTYSVPTSFPTDTVAPWAPQVSPIASPIPNSKTPVPSPSPSPTPTDMPTQPAGPTATPCTSNCGGGNDTLVMTGHTPPVWIAGQKATISLHANAGGVQMVFDITFPGSGFYTNGTPYTANANGDYTYSVTVPAGTTAGPADIYVLTQFPDGGQPSFHFYVDCTP